ncbi:pyroglutamyl-peptidase [Kutzneria sp. 744]|nr:pyroglutamyl-peptidase [Kutzneria sp. 744]
MPIKAGAKAMRDAGVPAAVSYSAGTFVCNHVFYGLMHLIATELPHVRGGFVHVPYSAEMTAGAAADRASLPVRTIADGLAAFALACVQTSDDLRVGEGTLH